MTLDKRQKVLVVLVVIALAVLAWQVYEFIGPKDSTSQIAARSTSAKAMLNAQDAQTANALTNAAQVVMPQGTNGAQIQENQQQYMQLITQYQMAQIKRMIAQDNEAIAQANYSAAEAMNNISKLSGGASGLSSMQPDNVSSSGDYQLVYTGEQNNQWTATLKKGGQFHDVTTGSQLPDGTQVLSVDDNSVLIQEGTAKKLVTFHGVTVLDPTTPAAATTTTVTATAATPATPVPVPADNKVAAAPATTDPTTSSPAVTPAPQAQATPAPAQNETKKIEKEAEHVFSDVKKEADATFASPSEDVSSIAPAPVAKIEKPVAAKKTTVAVDTTTTPAVATQAGYFYTIQVIADHKLGAVQGFIAAHNLTDKAIIIKNPTSSWYEGLYGQYDTLAQANAAVSDLQQSDDHWKPYVRYLSQQTIDAETVK